MTDVHELEQRRLALATQLAALTGQRDHAFRANSDALALQRAGVTHHDETKMTAFATNEISDDSTITGLRREIALLDAELSKGGAIGRRTRRLMRRDR